MIIKNTIIEELNKAMELTNQKYDDNIIFNRCEAINKKGSFRVTLRVKDSKGKGALIRDRRTINACWHAHGDFFNNLLKINNMIEISSYGKTINSNGGNWQEIIKGSLLNPIYLSECCEC